MPISIVADCPSNLNNCDSFRNNKMAVSQDTLKFLSFLSLRSIGALGFIFLAWTALEAGIGLIEKATDGKVSELGAPNRISIGSIDLSMGDWAGLLMACAILFGWFAIKALPKSLASKSDSPRNQGPRVHTSATG